MNNYNIKEAIKTFEEDFKPRKKIVLGEDYWREFAESKSGKNALNWYNQIRMTNSYAEAKQHNLI